MGQPRRPGEDARCDVLIVGAGPTGLALAAQLRAFGVPLRLVDAASGPVHESRALAVQPRTLEVLHPLGVAAELIDRGNPAVRLRVAAGGRVATTPLFDIGAEDTAYPYLLFVSQAETEAVLGRHLASRGVAVERGVTFETHEADGAALRCSLRRPDGALEVVRARYLVGCDGAHSTVREQAGIPFRGGRYPQTFVLADLAADGLEPGAVNAHLGPDGPLFFFPLDHPAPWRLVTVRADGSPPDGAAAIPLPELQALADRATGGAVRVSDPVWTSAFRIHHRAAATYRAGPVFVAGDAAHVHSPAGAQGMNTGIQDAVDLGWQLALVCRGAAPESLLDAYDAERRPVGEFVLRFTDRVFTVATSAHPLVRAVRTRLAPRVLPLALRSRAGRRLAFRTVSQLGVRYRQSPAVQSARRRAPGPRPGDRLPDARVLRAGEEMWLLAALTAPAFHLLLCGPPDAWDDGAVEELRRLADPWLAVLRLVPRPEPGDRPGRADLVDVTGAALSRLRAVRGTVLVVRPDGHIGSRADDGDLAAARDHLAGVLAGPAVDAPAHPHGSSRTRGGRRRTSGSR